MVAEAQVVNSPPSRVRGGGGLWRIAKGGSSGICILELRGFLPIRGAVARTPDPAPAEGPWALLARSIPT